MLVGSQVTLGQTPGTRHTGSMQKELVAKLTGHLPLESGFVLTQRSKSFERAIAAQYLEESLKSIGLQARKHQYTVSNINLIVDMMFHPIEGTNIYAIIPATNASDEYVVFGAHYDSEPGSPGAIDNASGVALCYAVAKQLAELQVRNRNFVVVFFDQEEDDEIGSRAFAQWAKEEGRNVHSVHTTDLVGWDNNGNRAVELQSPAAMLESTYKAIAERLGIPIHITTGASSDNKSFLEMGFDTIAISEEWFNGDHTPHIHKPTDVYSTVNFEYLSSTTELVYEVMKQLAEN